MPSCAARARADGSAAPLRASAQSSSAKARRQNFCSNGLASISRKMSANVVSAWMVISSNRSSCARPVTSTSFARLPVSTRSTTARHRRAGMLEPRACGPRSPSTTILPKWEQKAGMRIIAKSTLKRFWQQPGCADARGPLESWHEEALKAIWKSPQDVKEQYASASICGNNRVVFNVGGNKYRLVVEMQYRAGIVWVKFIGTHEQYDRINVESVNDY